MAADRTRRAGVPSRGRNLGERWRNTDAEFEIGHGSGLLFRLYAGNGADSLTRLRGAHHDIVPGRDAIDAVALLGVAIWWNSVAALDRAGNLPGLANAPVHLGFGKSGRCQIGKLGCAEGDKGDDGAYPHEQDIGGAAPGFPALGTEAFKNHLIRPARGALAFRLAAHGPGQHR